MYSKIDSIDFVIKLTALNYINTICKLNKIQFFSSTNYDIYTVSLACEKKKLNYYLV